MPVIHIGFTAGELFQAAVDEGDKLATEILKLADLSVCPLNPGESVPDRHHKIAKLGKQLAETFKSIDSIVKTVEEHRRAHAEAHGAPPPSDDKPDDTKAN